MCVTAGKFVFILCLYWRGLAQSVGGYQWHHLRERAFPDNLWPPPLLSVIETARVYSCDRVLSVTCAGCSTQTENQTQWPVKQKHACTMYNVIKSKNKPLKWSLCISVSKRDLHLCCIIDFYFVCFSIYLNYSEWSEHINKFYSYFIRKT